MKCSYCGKTYDDDFSYCPYCAEPKPVERVEETPEQIVKHETAMAPIVALGVMVMAYIPCAIAVWVVDFLILFSDNFHGANNTIDDMLSWKTIFLIALAVDFVIGLVVFVSEFFKTPREKIISHQFSNDQTSICPRCGSHNISLGRKGYDWNKGFWYSMFNIKGGHYIAGMNSRQVVAYCNNCNHKWETNRQWIK